MQNKHNYQLTYRGLIWNEEDYFPYKEAFFAKDDDSALEYVTDLLTQRNDQELLNIENGIEIV